MREYDYIIIGGGAAGFSSLIKINELTEGKARILMVSKGLLGGTCVNTGCVPSKTLIEVAKQLKSLNKFRDRGLTITEYDLDFQKLFESIRGLTTQLRKSKYEDILKEIGNVEFVKGEARFIDKNTIQVDGAKKEIFKGRKILIATGSRPNIPKIEGIDKVDYYTTENIWTLNEKPTKMAVIGSGAIGLELSQAFARLGVEVHVIEVLDRPIPSTEPEISRMLTDILGREGVKFYFKTRIKEISKKNGEIELKLVSHAGEQTITVDTLLIAAGRRPNSDTLDLEKAGVEVDRRGFIKVDKEMKTSNPDIYAAGDVAGSPKPAMLETLAAREGVVAATSMAGEKPEPIDYNSVPVVVFTDPELAFVGQTEEKVMESLGACACRGVLFSNMPKSKILNIEDGYAKIVIDPYTGVVKGLHVLAPYASELIIQGSLYIRHGYNVMDVINVIQVFPTVSEIVKATGQAFIRRIDKMPCCVE